ncbi:Dynein heavy chain 9, axonemal, partial [Branchiostoma belcheri]
ARTFLQPEEIFKGEIEESLDKVRKAADVIELWRDMYEEHKQSLNSYFKEGKEAVEWEFNRSMVFTRLDSFAERLKVVLDLFETATEFNKLEKVEFAGVKGKSLSQQVVSIFDEFQDCFKVFVDSNYDSLDPKNDEFMADYKRFTDRIYDLDRRLGAIICQAFDDCSGIEAIFKLLDIFGSLLERPIITEDTNSRYPTILSMYDRDLDTAKQMYDRYMTEEKANGGIPPVHKNMPPIAGALKWTQELRDRITQPMSNLKNLNHPCMDGEKARLMLTKYDEMMELLKNYEKACYQKWADGVAEACQFNLEQPLITRNGETKLISVNFSPQLVAVLREVKYLENLQRSDIPDTAAEIYAKNETFRKYRANLDLTVAWYNKVRENVLEVEFPLIEDQLAEIDNQLSRAEVSLSWKDDGVWEYIQETRDMVHDLEMRVFKAKTNLENVQKIMEQWCTAPLYERKDGKEVSLLNLDDREERLAKRYAETKESGNKIHDLVKENLGFFKAEEDTDIWRAYVDYVDDMVVDGFFNAIHCSLNFLLDIMGSKGQVSPLFESRLELRAPDMVFEPSLEFRAEDGFYDLMEMIINDIYKLASLVPRLAAHSGIEHYQPDLEEMDDLSDMRQELMDCVQSVMNQALEYRNSFDTYAYLWVDDRNEFMRQFLLYNHVLTPEEIEAHAEEGVPECPPTLEQFKEQIDTYEKIYDDLTQVAPTRVFDQWFRVDIKPFKQGLLNTVKRWSLLFKQHLIDHVTNSLQELSDFINVANAGLSQEVEEGDYDGLVGVMGHLMAVRDRQATTDEMFEPLKHTIELLKTYDQEMSEEVHTQLQELPEQWNNSKKVAIQVKQQVAPLQANEVAIIRRKCASFDVKQHEFREVFRKLEAFRFDCQEPYSILDKCNADITDMEQEMAALQASAGLFEVNVPDYKQLKQCRKEIKMLKTLWDMIILVLTSTDDWKTTLWKDINVEQMEMDSKKFAKDIRSLDKEMRAWDSFIGLDNTVKNMLTSLRAVGELQNPAIRERHWQQLMQATKVKFIMDDSTTLADLLALNLHNFEDTVRDIVDKAVKESGMEKVLKELDVTWKSMEFENEKHARTGVTLLKASEELIETLEDNQVQLQNLMTSKYIAHFLEEVSGWQKKLSTADSVISIFFEVQRTWSHLESIFIGSEDIRSQLPEDSKRFDGIDVDFKAGLEELVATPNVVQATNKKGLYEKLEALQGGLTLCEKALAEYLETKRLAFPRFYFVSSADLLDILSNGNQPVVVSKHLSKLFDNMVKLKFEEDSAGEPTKMAVGMYSGEGEYVDFDQQCDCNGQIGCNRLFGVGMYSGEGEYVDFDQQCDCNRQVEVWLNRLMDRMRETVRLVCAESVITYEEKPRDQWLFDYCAQPALTVNQIWWNTEVVITFGRLEEGYENAMKEFNKKQINQLNQLITHLLGELTRGDRQKIMTICTIDVHNRDVVQKMILNKTETAQAFLWQSQLRHRWDENQKHCFANICDAQFKYSYEYLGNTPRLVITPLTDRCYITLTQSLHLIMGGAPAGPAGTGKTETTKDLGRALGIMVYVFNCSEQMDYKSCGNIFKGLSQTGAWGCFDEFNRISVEVLSVVAVQVKSIQDAIRDKKKRYL